MPDFTFDKNNEWPKTITFNRPGKYICYITDEITYVDHRAMGLNYSQRKKRMERESQYKKSLERKDALPS